MSDNRDSSDDEDEQHDDDDEEGGEDEEEEEQQHELIPPFVPNQTVFTCHVEQPRSPRSAYAIPQSQAKKTERFFEAVIRQARHHANDSSWEFKIHFKGWNARYDNWLPASQLLPDTPETREKYNKQQQREKCQQQAKDEAKKQEQLRKKQQKKEQQQYQQRVTAEYTGAALPFTLKCVLVEEREKITRRGYDAPYGYDYDMKPPPTSSSSGKDKGKGGEATTASNVAVLATRAKGPPRSVHALPAAVTIRQLLKHFEKKTRKEWQQKQDNNNNNNNNKKTGGEEETDNKTAASAADAASNQFKQEIRQFCKGLGRLFETALPVCLLYPQERPQYQYYASKHQSVLDVYGCEFLLRLLLRLPQLMGAANSSSSNNNKAPPALVGDLTVLLQQNRPACFKGKFRPPIYPHEWLGWEKKYFGNPSNKEQQQKVEAAVPTDKEEEEGE